MNKSYKLVFNKKRGEFVVASELAQGAKKNSSKKLLPLVAALLLLPLSQNVYAANDVVLETSYQAAQLNWTKDENGIDIVNKTTPIKDQQTKGNKVLETDGEHNISFAKSKVKTVIGEYPFKKVNFEDLIKTGEGRIFYTPEDGEAQELKSLDDVTWDNIVYDPKTRKYSVDKVNGTVGKQLVTLASQPVIPYYQLNMVTAKKGSMVFAEQHKKGEGWKFGQAKKSELFIAEEGVGITVQNGARLEVDFGDSYIVKKPKDSEPESGVFAAQLVWTGKTWNDLNKDEKLFGGILALNIDEELARLDEAVGLGDVKDTITDGLNTIQYKYNELAALDKKIEGDDLSDKERPQLVADQANKIIEVMNLYSELSQKSEGFWGSVTDDTLKDYLTELKSLLIKNKLSEYSWEMEAKEVGDLPFYTDNDALKAPGGNNHLFVSGKNSKVVFDEGSDIYVRFGNVLTAKQSKTTVSGKIEVERGNIIDATGGTVTLEESAELTAKNGLVVRGREGAIIKNFTVIEAYGEKAANVYISGRNTEYTQENQLYFNMTKNGAKEEGTQEGPSIGAWGDRVTDGAKYINKQDIYSTGIKGDEKSDSIFGTIEASNGAIVENKGNIFLASHAKENAFSNGILVKEGEEKTRIENKDSIFVGYKDTVLAKIEKIDPKDDAGAITSALNEGRSSSEVGKRDSRIDARYNSKDMHNAILVVNTDETKDGKQIGQKNFSIDLKDTGKIYLSHDSAGINIEGLATDHKNSLKNDGNIYVNGDYSVGIRVAGNDAKGSDLANKNSSDIQSSGNIYASGAGSTGFYVKSGIVAELTGGKITVHGTSDNDDGTSYGAYVSAGKLILTENPTDPTKSASISVSGKNAVGARVESGGMLTLKNAESIELIESESGDNITQYWISGFTDTDGYRSSTIDFGSDTIELTLGENYTNSTLIRVDGGATFGVSDNDDELKSALFLVNASGGVGLDIANNNTKVTAGKGFEFRVEGKDATGIRVTKGAGSGESGNIVLDTGTILSVKGEGATVALIDGSKGEAELISKAKLTSQEIGKDAYGYKILTKGTLIHEGEIDLDGEGVTAIRVEGGTLDNRSEKSVRVNGKNAVGVDIYGADSKIKNLGNITALNGKAAVNLNAGASLTVSGEDGSPNDGLISGAETADAIRINSGATLDLENANVAVSGTGAGLHFQNAGDSNDKFHLKGSGSVKVSGAGTGVLVSGKDGVTISNSFDSTGSSGLVIEVGDKGKPNETFGGEGIVTNTSGQVLTGTSVKMYGNEAEAALQVMGGTQDIVQFGALESWATAGNVVDLRSQSIVVKEGSVVPDTEDKTYKFKNLGEIKAHKTGSNAIIAKSNYKNVSDDDKITIINGNSDGAIANIEGKILLEGSANYLVQLYGGSSSTITETGAGNDTFELIDVKGSDDSSQLFKELNGGDGNNTLVLKATNPNGNVEKEASSHYVYTDDVVVLKNIANLEVKQSARFELDNRELVDVTNNKHLNIDIVNGGQLFIKQDDLKKDSKYFFKNKLKGNGLVTTNLNGISNQFNFTKNNHTEEGKSGDFKGIFAIDNGSFDIAGLNSNALKDATLRIDKKHGEGGLATIKNGLGEKIGGLAFNGGTLVVEELLYGQKEIGSILTVDTLNFNEGSGQGKIQVTLDDHFNEVFEGFDKDPNQPLHSADLLAQDQGEHTIKLVDAGKVEGKAGGVGVELQYKDKDNKVASIDGDKIQQELDIVQNENDDVVAKGTYDIKAQTTDGKVGSEIDGLYLAYALSEVELIGTVDKSYSGALNLSVADKDADGKSAEHYSDLEAKITGAGDLVINTGDNVTLSLSNGNNDYEGKTYVLTGDLYLAQSGVLGKTSLLDIAKGHTTVFADLNDNKNQQTVGQLSVASGAGLDLGKSGVLTVRGDQKDDNGNSKIAGALSGKKGSKIIIEQKTLRVEGGNDKYLGHVDVANNATLELNHARGVGYTSGAIELAGKLHLNGAKGKFEKTINGDNSNEVLVNNNSTVIFASNHTGVSNINIGTHVDNPGKIPDSRMIIEEERFLGIKDKPAIDIRTNSTLQLDASSGTTWVVSNAITGTGDLHKTGAGEVELTEEAVKYTGKTIIDGGFVTAGKDFGTKIHLASSGMEIAKGASFEGYGSIAGSVMNEGNFFVGKRVDLSKVDDLPGYIQKRPEYTEDEAGVNEVTGNDVSKILEDNSKADYVVGKDFTNKGNIFLSNSFKDDELATGTNLLVKGDYISSGGAIFMNTVLNAGHKEASSDKLIVEGDVKTQGGATKLYISNAQGLGAYTDQQPDAIKVVHVDGTSAHNAFVLGNRVAIGVYEYSLHKGRNPENAQSWFLDSYDKNLNPGIGAFIGNQNAAIGMFSMTLHDRMGNLGYSDPSLITEGDDTLNSAWVRIVAERNKYKAIDQKMSIKSNTYIVHLGTDFYKWTDDLGATRRLGVMAGYGHGDIKSRSDTGFDAQGKIDSAYNVGLYGTYYNPNGFYVDAWAQHSWFKNEISIGGASKNYRSKLLSLSLEVGHTFDISEVSSEGKQWRFQPQGQITWHKYKLRNNAVSDSGLAVTKLPSHTTVARLGAKFIYANAQDVDSKMQPFVELNWIHSNANKAIEFNDWYTTSNNAPKNRYELKVGIEGKYNNRWSVWGNVATQMGKDSYRNYRGTLGAKYDF